MRGKKVLSLLGVVAVVLAVLGATAAADARATSAPAAEAALAPSSQETSGEPDLSESEDGEADDAPVSLPTGGISADQATAAALAAFPGTSAVSVDLDDENGTIVYSVELGDGREVKVDAADGTVIASESADKDEQGGQGVQDDREDQENQSPEADLDDVNEEVTEGGGETGE